MTVPISTDSEGLVPVTLESRGRLFDLFEANGRACWFLYPPFLHLTGLRRGHRILEEAHDGAVTLYKARDTESGRYLELFVPPIPATPATLAHAVARVRAISPASPVRIRHVEERDLAAVARAGFVLRDRDEEFIYDTAKITALEGSDFRRLRREIAKTSAHSGLSVRDYAPGDEDACLAVLDRWRERLKAADLPAEGYRLTANCLRHASGWPPDAIRGRVCDVNGEVRGFAFSGPISRSCGNMFICITDTDLRGLAYLMRYDQVTLWPTLAEFNSGGDAGRSGLSELKQSFRPVRMQRIYRATMT